MRLNLVQPEVRLNRRILHLVNISILLLLFGAIYARYFRYSILRPLWYVNGSQLPDELVRDARAREYLASFKDERQRVYAPRIEASICVVIPSASRVKEYVFRSIAALTLSVSQAKEKKVKVHGVVVQLDNNNLCERLSRFTTNSGFECITRANAIETTLRHDLKEAARQTANAGSQDYDLWLRRQRSDFALSFDYCLHTSPLADVVLMEDDGLFAINGIERTAAAIKELASRDPDWMLLKLFTSDHFEGWEDYHRPVLIIGSLLLAYPLAWLLTKHPHTHLKTQPLFIAHYIFVAIWIPLSLLILGKQHLPLIGSSLDGGVVQIDAGARVGSIGWLYEKRFTAQLVEELPKIRESGFSLNVDVYINEHVGPKKAYELLPNVVDHIGFVSSSNFKNDEKNPWSGYWYPYHVRSASFHRSMGSPF
jgi:hypothetical protein